MKIPPDGRDCFKFMRRHHAPGTNSTNSIASVFWRRHSPQRPPRLQRPLACAAAPCRGRRGRRGRRGQWADGATLWERGCTSFCGARITNLTSAPRAAPVRTANAPTRVDDTPAPTGWYAAQSTTAAAASIADSATAYVGRQIPAPAKTSAAKNRQRGPRYSNTFPSLPETLIVIPIIHNTLQPNRHHAPGDTMHLVPSR